MALGIESWSHTKAFATALFFFLPFTPSCPNQLQEAFGKGDTLAVSLIGGLFINP
jgi:hypothetical protein